MKRLLIYAFFITLLASIVYSGPEDNLIWGYDFENASNTTMIDVVGNVNGSNSGTNLKYGSDCFLGNCREWEKTGQSTGDHINVTKPLPSGLSSWTLLAWIKGKSIASPQACQEIIGCGSNPSFQTSLFHNANDRRFLYTDGANTINTGFGGDATKFYKSGWNMFTISFNLTNGTLKTYSNKTLITTTSGSSGWTTPTMVYDWALGSQGTGPQYTFDGYIDEVYLYNKCLTGSEINSTYDDFIVGTRPYDALSIISISNANCTSCDPPNGDTTSPYTTSDTTPTFTLDTNINGNCRIGDENITYSAMGSSRDCASGQGTTSHTCTLTTQDELIYTTDYVYVVCLNIAENNEASIELEMNITYLGNTSSHAIDTGIQSSEIWPGATIYEDQQVYLRDLGNNQVVATVDRIAAYGNQRWVLNHALENESKLGLFNITPAVYVLDIANMSSHNVHLAVSNLINSTKT